MTGYFDKRKKQKLYRQWVEESDLPPDKIPPELAVQDDRDEPVYEDDEAAPLRGRRSFTFHLTTRHLLYLILVIVGLLISTVSLATVLIMRSCQGA